MAAGLIKQFNQFLTGADLAWQASVGPGLVLPHPVGVVLGPYCVVGDRCLFQQGVTLGGNGNPGEGSVSSPTIGDRVVVGAGARVLGNLTLGTQCRVGANAVVTKSMPSGALVVGVPAVAKEGDPSSDHIEMSGDVLS
ncbi:serine O-acetyltransferase [Gordonia sp. HS-NH1]|uniref:serine O-acetyltransferase n=1 Tax=Gordonia sp. HS-NH1 TaxID=1435068 RepID=UPI003FA538C9